MNISCQRRALSRHWLLRMFSVGLLLNHCVRVTPPESCFQEFSVCCQGPCRSGALNQPVYTALSQKHPSLHYCRKCLSWSVRPESVDFDACVEELRVHLFMWCGWIYLQHVDKHPDMTSLLELWLLLLFFPPPQIHQHKHHPQNSRVDTHSRRASPSVSSQCVSVC